MQSRAPSGVRVQTEEPRDESGSAESDSTNDSPEREKSLAEIIDTYSR